MQPRLFVLGDPAFGTRAAAAAEYTISEHEERSFEDGEHKTRPLESVRGADVYVLDSLHGDATRSVNDRLCRLLFFIGALRDAGATRITAAVPYLCYSRKDRRTKWRDPITTRYVATLLEAVGTDVVLTVDVHNIAAFENAFRCRTTHLSAHRLLAARIAPTLSRPVIVVSPDTGGAKRADAMRMELARNLGADVALGFVEKKRSEGVVTGGVLAGDVEGATVLLVDDLVSSGTTLTLAARTCRERGAHSIVAAVTHGLFTADSASVFTDSAIERLFMTNTVPRPVPDALRDRVDVVDMAPFIGRVIRRLHEDGSLVELVDGSLHR